MLLHSGLPRLSSCSRRHFLQVLARGNRVLRAFLWHLRADCGNDFFQRSKKFLALRAGFTGRTPQPASAEKYLPEATGPGCAFLDYDNDGWLDIYLVNSGKCDFFTPAQPLRNALYRNNRDGTFTDVTEQAGVRGGDSGWGSPSATTTTTVSPIST